ncbi:uncharacterized protein IL334_004808 [Kwoniella shivajii]|uniref:Sulfhydryl oxidase n=1 Tax=Kwoniella shivajii TaxID=564305 RepID=A0ABZ1D395_9TREE|nr:hypothetical protein IL334_004808 [Kwoniella shivajii]
MAIPNNSSDPDVSTQPRRTTKETHPNLPPGLILDENGKVCKVCNSWQDFAKIKKKQSAPGSGDGKGRNVLLGGAGMGGFASLLSNSNTTSNPAFTSKADKEVVLDRKDCPPDTAALGRSTWTFLHTTAAYYPLQANSNQQFQMTSLLSSLSIFYPCNWCATDFQKDIRKNPPDVSGREGLMRWLCERHNEVNQKLGKITFDCGIKNLDERWKDGPEDGRCD